MFLISIRLLHPMMTEKKVTLRWLIACQPRSLEHSYYLLFLLTANRNDEEAMEECLRLLKRSPDNQIAHRWRKTIRTKWYRIARLQVSAHHVRRNRH